MKIGGKGFTLTEILVVIVILATMAALVLPRLGGQPERALVAEAIQNLSAIRQAELAYALEHSGTWGTLDQIDVDVMQGINFDYTVDGSGNARAKRNDPSNGPYNDTTIILNTNGSWGGDHPLGPATWGP